MKKVLILEDQEETRNALVAIVKRVDGNAVVFELSSADEAYAIAMKHTIDLFILDIILKPGDKYRDSSGADFAQNIRDVARYQFTPIIFLTSLYDEKLNMYSNIRCFSYIEKPCNYEQVEQVIRKAISFHTKNGVDRKYFYRNHGILEALCIKDIIYVARDGGNLLAVTPLERRVIPYKSLKLIRNELDTEDFLQCNRSAIVNQWFIREIDPVNRYIYLNECEDILEIGAVLRKTFMKEIWNVSQNLHTIVGIEKSKH